MPFLYLNDQTGHPLVTIEYNETTVGTFVIPSGALTSVGINSTAQISPVPTTPSTSTSTLWPSDSTMFLPTGHGVLYYHALRSLQTSDSGYPTTYIHQRHTAVYPTPSRVKALAKPAIMAGRRALRRSIDLFRMLRSDEEIKTFISGKPLIVRGHHFDYRIQKRDNLLRHTMNPNVPHIPYDFQMLSKATGQSLANGCTVIRGTPVIDQLLALLLHLEDPDDEVTILWNTNWHPDVSRLLPAGRWKMRLAA